MKKVSDIFLHKERKITAVPPSTSVLEALQIMSIQNIGSVMVMENQDYLGIMTERDYSRKVILKKANLQPIRPYLKLCRTTFPAVNLYDSIEHCMQLMADKNIRYPPGFRTG